MSSEGSEIIVDLEEYAHLLEQLFNALLVECLLHGIYATIVLVTVYKLGMCIKIVQQPEHSS